MIKKILSSLLVIAVFFSANPAYAALKFVSSGTSRVGIKNVAPLNDMTAFTYLAWVNPTSIVAGNSIIVKSVGTSNQKRFTVSSTAGDMNCRVSGTTAANYISATGVFATNTPVFVACVYDSTAATQILFYKGTPTSTARPVACVTCTNGATESVDANAYMLIGNNAGAQGFGGYIMWAGVWNRALSAKEIAELQFSPHVSSGCVVNMFLGNPSSTYIPNLCGAYNGILFGTTTNVTLIRNFAPVKIRR